MPKTCDCYGDADFAARETQLRSTTGTADCLGKHTLESSSSTQSVRPLSTGEAEFYAIVTSAASCLHTQAILLGFGVTLQAQVLSGATAGIGIASQQGCGKLKRLEVRWLWIQEKVAEQAIVFKKQRGETNGADLGTKYLLLGLLALAFIQKAESTGLVLAGAAAVVTSGGTWFSTVFLTCVMGLARLMVGWTCGRRSAARAATRTTAATTSSPTTPLATSSVAAAATSTTSAPFDILQAVMFLSFMTMDELRVLLRSRGLPTGGDKQALSERFSRRAVLRWGQVQFLGFLTVGETKVLLRSRGQLVGGNKTTLSERLERCAAAV